MFRNQITVGGVITDLISPRYTPAGIMVVEFKLNHQSDQQEAGAQRSIELAIEVIAMAKMAEKVICAGLDRNIEITGFIAKKHRLGNQLVLHVCDVRII
ncbi:primosomal replication protein N [Nitrosomonas sp.]|uniref:primosomal replication protein N n=1 Tax=Nitrosomonas sp. TaxID=42353 RepID=UPI0025CD36FD|nr:primosomal replication protein N [Nitrosomonas sp.]MCC6915940.1 primosomal replication protein N [Nitrosomonas sp.]